MLGGVGVTCYVFRVPTGTATRLLIYELPRLLWGNFDFAPARHLAVSEDRWNTSWPHVSHDLSYDMHIVHFLDKALPTSLYKAYRGLLKGQSR